MKKIVFIGIGVIVFLGIVTAKPNKTTDKNNGSSVSSSTATAQTTATDEERGIFYKCFEYEWNLPTVPIGDKSRHSKAISLTAEEFHISTAEAEKIYEKVTKAKSSDKEIEIYEAFENRLDEALDEDSLGKPFNEDAIKKEIAKKYNITTIKLDAIWVLVESNAEYQKQWKSKVAQKTKEAQIKVIIEKRKKILDNYLSILNEAGMNQFVEIVSYKYADINECSIIIKVRNTWHYQLKQLRLQAAQNLWELWSQSYYLESERDKCRMELVDLNGNGVGGSSWLGGSVVNVKD